MCMVKFHIQVDGCLTLFVQELFVPPLICVQKTLYLQQCISNCVCLYSGEGSCAVVPILLTCFHEVLSLPFPKLSAQSNYVSNACFVVANAQD